MPLEKVALFGGQREPVSDLPRSASHQRPRLPVIRWFRSGDRNAGVRVSVLFDFGTRRCGYCPHLGHAAVERVRYVQVTVSVIRTSR